MTQTATESHAPITVNIQVNDRGVPAGKLADAELYFHTGPLTGMRLLGFAVWKRRTGPGNNVTFPARTYSVQGERRSFSLLRPNADLPAANEGVRDLVLAAYDAAVEGGK